MGEERHETYCEVERDDRERRDVEWQALYSAKVDMIVPGEKAGKQSKHPRDV